MVFENSGYGGIDPTSNDNDWACMGLPEEHQGILLVSGSVWLASLPNGPNAGLPPLHPAENTSTCQ